MRAILLRLGFIFLAAIILTILPFPGFIAYLKPIWILLGVLYIQFYLPKYFYIFTLIILGLILDALLSSVIGEHVLALSLTTWIAHNRARRFRFFTIEQQMALIGVLSCIYQFSLLIIDAFLGFAIHPFLMWGSAFINILIWPWIRLLGEEYLLNYSILPRSQIV